MRLRRSAAAALVLLAAGCGSATNGPAEISQNPTPSPTGSRFVHPIGPETTTPHPLSPSAG